MMEKSLKWVGVGLPNPRDKTEGNRIYICDPSCELILFVIIISEKYSFNTSADVFIHWRGIFYFPVYILR